MSEFSYVVPIIAKLSAKFDSSDYKLINVRGIPQNPSFVVSRFEEIIDTFKTRDNDVFVTTFVKAGCSVFIPVFIHFYSRVPVCCDHFTRWLYDRNLLQKIIAKVVLPYVDIVGILSAKIFVMIYHLNIMLIFTGIRTCLNSDAWLLPLGTTWTQQIIHQLLKEGEPGGFYGETVPWLEATASDFLQPREAPTWTLDKINNAPVDAPRYFKTHATVGHLPRGDAKIKGEVTVRISMDYQRYLHLYFTQYTISSAVLPTQRH